MGRWTVVYQCTETLLGGKKKKERIPNTGNMDESQKHQ